MVNGSGFKVHGEGVFEGGMGVLLIPLCAAMGKFTQNRRTKQEQSQACLNYALQGGGIRSQITESTEIF